MALSLLSVFLGFVLGVVALGIAWTFTRSGVRNPESTRLTALWSLKDVSEPGLKPGIIAESLDGIALAPGSKVIVPREAVSTVPADVLATCEVRMHPEVRINAAIGRDRALVFSGHVTPKAFAVFTQDHHAVHLLQADFQRMWAEGSPYVEKLSTIADLAGKQGRHVELTGRAVELMEFRGKKMLRLTDGKTNVGLVSKSEDATQWQGGIVRVTGRFVRDGGYAYIDADKVTVVQAAVPA